MFRDFLCIFWNCFICISCNFDRLDCILHHFVVFLMSRNLYYLLFQILVFNMVINLCHVTHICYTREQTTQIIICTFNKL
jgi:hypothetical protein